MGKKPSPPSCLSLLDSPCPAAPLKTHEADETPWQWSLHHQPVFEARRQRHMAEHGTPPAFVLETPAWHWHLLDPRRHVTACRVTGTLLPPPRSPWLLPWKELPLERLEHLSTQLRRRLAEQATPWRPEARLDLTLEEDALHAVGRLLAGTTAEVLLLGLDGRKQRTRVYLPPELAERVARLPGVVLG